MKNKGMSLITKTLLSMVFALLVAAVLPSSKVEAAPSGTVTGLRQTYASSSAIEFEFTSTSLENDIYYSIQISTSANGNYENRGTTQSTSVYLYNLPNAGSSYYVKVVPFYSVWHEDTLSYEPEYGTPSAALEVVTAPNAAPSKLSHDTSTTTSITMSWSKVNGANAYQVVYYKSGENKKTANTNATSLKLSKLSKNSCYYVSVYPIRTSASGFKAIASNYVYSSTSVPVVPSKASAPTITNYWKSSKEISISTTAMDSADGYQYQVYTAYKKKDTKVKSATSTSASTYIKSTQFGKCNLFKVRVRAYCLNSKNEKKYGTWSTWTYVSTQPNVTKATYKTTGLNIKWDTIQGADRYIVYVSTKKDSGYKKFTTTKKTSVVITKCNKKKLKKGTTYYFYVEPQVKVGKKYVSTFAGDANYCWSKIYQK